MSSQALEKGKGFDVLTSVRSAFEIMAKGAPAVAQSLVDIAVHGKSEIARVQAAQAVLNRIGLSERIEIGITPSHLFGEEQTGTAGPSAASLVANRLAELRQQANAVALAAAVSEDMDIEGEVLADVIQLHAVIAPTEYGPTEE